MNLTKEFQKFVGKQVREANHPRGYAIDDPVMKEIFELAAQKGLSVRTLAPGQPSTDDYIGTRLNVHLDWNQVNAIGHGSQLRVKSFDIG